MRQLGQPTHANRPCLALHEVEHQSLYVLVLAKAHLVGLNTCSSQLLGPACDAHVLQLELEGIINPCDMLMSLSQLRSGLKTMRDWASKMQTHFEDLRRHVCHRFSEGVLWLVSSAWILFHVFPTR